MEFLYAAEQKNITGKKTQPLNSKNTASFQSKIYMQEDNLSYRVFPVTQSPFTGNKHTI